MDNTFLTDVQRGLKKHLKKLPSKYFYDARGDELFRQIMDLPEYYLTDCEFEILSERGAELLKTAFRDTDRLNLLELGAGDGYKTKLLLKEVEKENLNVTYMPVDISGNILSILQNDLNREFPGLKVETREMDYIEAVKQTQTGNGNKNLILFLGSTVGNLPDEERSGFFRSLSASCNKGDEVLIGFDLQKDPRTILAAYNDSKGVTKAFNLNLISRLKNELNININPDDFAHFPVYDPLTGTARSFVIAEKDMNLKAGNEHIYIEKGEVIHCEDSRKFTLEQIEQFTKDFGFQCVHHYMDRKKYFADSLWRKI